MPKALEGIKVVEWGEFISAPYCSKLLAHMGAEVIKVENLDGDYARRHGPFPGDVPNPEKSGLFLYLNADKKGITLNLESSHGKHILRQLLTRVDIFVENQPKDVVEKCGLDYANLKKINRKLIVNSISPFGRYGPYSSRRAYDLNVCAIGEVSYCIGERGRTPLTLPYYQTEFQGGVVGAGGTLIALLARDLTGEGQQVDISNLDVMVSLHPGSKLMNFVYFGGISGQRDGRRRREPYPFVYLPSKDRYMCFFTREGRHWKTFIEMVGDQDLLHNPRYRDHRAMGVEYPEEVDAKLIPWLKQRTSAELFEAFRKLGLPFVPIRTIDEVVGCPHLEARGYFEEVDHPIAGKVKYAGAPYKLSETPWKMASPAPTLGQHNEDILSGWLGYSKEELASLHSCEVI